MVVPKIPLSPQIASDCGKFRWPKYVEAARSALHIKSKSTVHEISLLNYAIHTPNNQ